MSNLERMLWLRIVFFVQLVVISPHPGGSTVDFTVFLRHRGAKRQLLNNKLYIYISPRLISQDRTDDESELQYESANVQNYYWTSDGREFFFQIVS